LKFQDLSKVHFIGIGGIGMSALAKLLLYQGVAVSGSDMKDSPVLEELRTLGAVVWPRHDPSHVPDADLVVVSSAVPPQNLERLQAQKMNLKIVSRAQLLGEIMKGHFGIAVSGTHGKTTTTGMVGLVLEYGGLDPTVLVGGELPAFRGNLRIGHSDYFVAEACEAFDSFLTLYPRLSVVTNIDADHLDYYGSLDRILASFEQFLHQTDEGGVVVACADNPPLEGLLSRIPRRAMTYGFSPEADLRADKIQLGPWGCRFACSLQGNPLGEIRLHVPGRQNIQNALAAVAVGLEVGLPFEVISKALKEFCGVGRRMELLGAARDIMVVDDYAHHPTEIRATLQAAKESWGRRLVAVFQPHLYSRTRLLLEDFAAAFAAADEVIITEIYPAREQPIEGVTGRLIVDTIRARAPEKPVHFIPDKSEVPGFALDLLHPGDMLLTMGAGDIRVAGETLLKRLKEPPAGAQIRPSLGDACSAFG